MKRKQDSLETILGRLAEILFTGGGGLGLAFGEFNLALMSFITSALLGIQNEIRSYNKNNDVYSLSKRNAQGDSE